MDDGAGREVNGDTVFEIGSITKTFTALLLQDMIERGAMRREDPVARYLPKSVRMPTRHGKEITLLQLATHTSGLPHEPDNLVPKRADNPRADYAAGDLYAFLSGYELTRDPGAEYEYSSLGVGLLGHVIALKAGTNYESLVVDRICRPLGMESTRISLTPELQARFAQGYNELGYPVSSWDYLALSGCGALRSTVNDLLKYTSANLGLTPSSLTPLMEKTHAGHFHPSTIFDFGLAWVIRQAHGARTVCHSGGTGGYSSFIGFDKTRRRGVVVLSNFLDEVSFLGLLLLDSEWQSDRRPKEAAISRQVYDFYVGQYQLVPDLVTGMRTTRVLLFNAPKTAIYILASLGLALLPILLGRAATWRRRWIILGCAGLGSGLLALLAVVVASQVVCARYQPGIAIRREGDRIFADYTFSKPLPPLLRGLKSHITGFMIGELLPESETRFFERLSGMPVAFSRDGRGNATCSMARDLGHAFSYKRTSEQPPKTPEPPKPRVAIKLDPGLLGACAGHYEFPPNGVFPPTGMKVRIWRQGEQLLWQAWGKDAAKGAIDLYPESETNFFLKFNGAQLTFLKNDKGEVTAVRHHLEGLPDCEGKKLPAPAD
jgi:CubicO group peptidase (beta-lactamase class C family)